MADSLKLVGVKRISNQTGNDLVLSRPTGGGDQFKIRRWWSDNKNCAVYVNCTKLAVSRPTGGVMLMVPTSQDTRLDIKFDGDSTWTFGPVSRSVDRVGVFTTNLELIEEYVFSSVSGGKVMKTIPAGAASYPA